MAGHEKVARRLRGEPARLRGFAKRAHLRQDVPADKVPVRVPLRRDIARGLGPVVVRGEGGVGPQGLLKLGHSPHVVGPLRTARAVLPRGVGVLGRVESPALPRHVAQDVVQGRPREPSGKLAHGGPAGVQRAGGDLRLVVEHLLEMGDEPFRIDGVAVETAADMVVDPAAGHRPDRPGDHPRGLDARLACEPLDCRAAKEEREVRGTGELRRPAKPAEPRVKGLRVVLVGLLEGNARGLARRSSPRRLRRQPPRPRAP